MKQNLKFKTLKSTNLTIKTIKSTDLWEPKFVLLISVELGKIGNPKFPRGPRYLLNNTPSNQNTKYTDETKYENRKRKQRMSYSESAYERYNKVRALAARAAGEFPSSNNLRLQKPS